VLAGSRGRHASAHALLIDFGGCLTNAFFPVFERACRARGLRSDAVKDLLMVDPIGHQLLMDVERGKISQPDFETGVADRLSTLEKKAVQPEGLIRDLLADLRPDAAMLKKMAEVRAAGILIGIISNSWGTEPYDPYAPWHLSEIADDVILSDEVGLRKPDRVIWELSCKRLGVVPSNCLWIDDIAAYLQLPREVFGMTTIHHTNADETLPQIDAWVSSVFAKA